MSRLGKITECDELQDDKPITAVDYLEEQADLEKQARELMPYEPDNCTYSMGALRQPVFACLTCKSSNDDKPNGICYACSIQCHSTHELVELFTKREFTCDCGTTRMKTNGGCKLRYRQSKDRNTDNRTLMRLGKSNNRVPNIGDDIPSLSNSYNQNFEGVFCECSRPYNPMEDSNMFQCQFGVACGEEWYHEECILGLRLGVIDRRPNKRSQSGENKLESLSEPGMEASTDGKLEEEEEEEDGNEILPLPGFPDMESFDTIICWKCTDKYKREFDCLAEEFKYQKAYHIKASTIEERDEALVKNETKKRVSEESYPYTLFLTEDFKDQIKELVSRVSEQQHDEEHNSLLKLLKSHSYMFEEDKVYEPPEDEDQGSSMFELGMGSLGRVPIEGVVGTMAAYEQMKQRLTEFLRPFAEQDQVVTKQAVTSFFEQQQQNGSL